MARLVSEPGRSRPRPNQRLFGHTAIRTFDPTVASVSGETLAISEMLACHGGSRASTVKQCLPDGWFQNTSMSESRSNENVAHNS